MADAFDESAPIERVPTGVPGLDTVLHGGLLRDGIYIVMGPPGAGKTILANQVCFHHVAGGGRAVYVTLLAETHARMLAHMRNLRFFDPRRIAHSLSYVSGYRVLEQEGLRGLLDVLRKEIRAHRATMLVLDGLVTAEAVAESELAFKKFIHELHTLIGVMNCTTLLLTNGGGSASSPEHTMVDGLLEICDQLVGTRASREIVVRKFRGSDHLRGRHTFEISGAGVTVYPRLESVLAAGGAEASDAEGRVPTGVAGFDAMLRGGLPAASTTLVLGPTGSGKTLLGSHFLAEGARRGEPGLHFTFFESPSRWIRKGERAGVALGEWVRAGLIEVIWAPASELSLDALGLRILEAVRRRTVKRLFLDGLVGFKEAALYPERVGRFLAALAAELRALGVTAVFSDETREMFGVSPEVPIVGVSTSFENIVLLRTVELRATLRRVVAVLKSREKDHDPALRECRVGAGGIEVGGPVEPAAEAVLSGLARVRPRSKKKPAARAKSDGGTRRGGARGRGN